MNSTYPTAAPYGATNTQAGRSDVFSYDYINVSTTRNLAPEVVDIYEKLGWTIATTTDNISSITINFKRDRKIKDKDNLNRLQTKLDNIIKDIQAFEKKKSSAATGAALGIGIPGTIVFGGGMSMVMLLEGIGFMIGGIALGLAGAAICGIAYLAYKKIRASRTAQMNAAIDLKREEISTLLEEASGYIG